ncbi:MAG: hypothetical protein RL693_1254 [Verrucomicrobiota bacterium]|jgi:hypothetical protein
MKTTLKLILAALIISFTGPGLLSAAETKAPAKEAEKPAAKEKPADKEKASEKDEAAPKKNTYPLYGQVVSANTRTLTIKGGEGKEDRKYSVNASTVIMKGDKPAAVEDIKEGQWIGGLLEKSAEGNDKVLKLNLAVKQKEAKSEEKPEAKPVAKTETKEEGKEEAKPKATKKKES